MQPHNLSTQPFFSSIKKQLQQQQIHALNSTQRKAHMSALFNQSDNNNQLMSTGKDLFRHTLEHGKSSIPQTSVKPLTLLHKLEKRVNQPLRKQLQQSKSGTRKQTNDTITHQVLKSSASNQRLKRKKKKLKTSSIGNIESLGIINDEQLNVQGVWSSTLSSKMKLVKMITSSKRPLLHPAKGSN